MTLDAFAMATLAAHQKLELNNVMLALETARLLTDALEFRSDPGVWAMVHGAGLIWHLEELHPFILANANLLELTDDGPADLLDSLRLAELMTSLLGGTPKSVFRTTKVVSVAAGVRHATPGDPVLATASGQMGPLVRWSSGREGFITAGHVAQSAQGPVTDANGVRIGTVLWSNDPALNPTTKGEVDAALVEFTPGASGQFGPRSTIVPAGGDPLRIVSSNSTANLLAACSRIQLGATNAHYADCYLTDRRITNPGDSGGLVETNGDVAGIVIGAFSRRDMSVIQSVGYQLAQIRMRSGHMVMT